MMGHTDRKTINERRPLTDGMRATLKALVRNGPVEWRYLSNGEKNQMRALMDRGYARPANDTHWEATDEGAAVVVR